MADIVRRDPFEVFARGGLHHMMDRLFEDTFPHLNGGGWSGSDEGTLPVDISEQGQQLIVRASVPGFAKEDIDVQVHEGVLSISAKHSEESEEKTETYYRRERRTGSVSRRIALPGVVHEAPVEASLKDGVLTLTISVPEASRPKQIEITAA